jgi:large subunit ribosomal protein L10
MSKKIKKMQIDSLAKTFEGVRNLVVVTVTGVDSQIDNKMRLDLRKKNIRMQMVKNSLARQVFSDMGIKLEKCWEGPTTVVWGANSVAELSRTLDDAIKKGDKVKDKIKIKTAVAEGEEVPFAKALTMPTRQEAIADLIALILSPAATLVSQIGSPGAQIASQIKTISERPAEPEAAAPAPPA